MKLKIPISSWLPVHEKTEEYLNPKRPSDAARQGKLIKPGDVTRVGCESPRPEARETGH